MSNSKHDKSGPESWQRWEMGNLGESVPDNSPAGSRLARRLAQEKILPGATRGLKAASENTHNPIPEDVLAQVARIGQDAREAAVKDGYAEGLKKGHAEGFARGKAEGQKNGHDEGYQAGHREGYEKGLAEGRAISSAQVQQLKTLLHSSAASIEALGAQVSESLVDLALNIARQVIRTSLEAQPEKVIDTVRDILQADNSDKGLLHLRLHPEDLILVKRHLADDPRLHKWLLEPDEHLERGGCIAQTPLGDIDATLKTRWERIAGTLREHPLWIENA